MGAILLLLGCYWKRNNLGELYDHCQSHTTRCQADL